MSVQHVLKFCFSSLLVMLAHWLGASLAMAELVCPDPNFPKTCYEVYREVPPPAQHIAPRPPQNFRPDVLEREIQRAFTVGNPPRGNLTPQVIMAPAFVDTAPDFTNDYPMCDTDGTHAICP